MSKATATTKKGDGAAPAVAGKRRVIICAGTGCVSTGALKVYDAFMRELKKKALNFDVILKPESENLHLSRSGCQGFCQMGPLVTIIPDDIFYTKVTADDVEEIVEKTLIKGDVVEWLLYNDPGTKQFCRGTRDIPFYQRQMRYVLKECGLIDPEDLNEYLSRKGYEAAKKAFLSMTPEAVCNEITASGLRGRGGGGFPTGRKWDAARIQPAAKKYVICNGDEGDPGAFMDRSVMEGNPHSVIEGVMIAARAIGADEAYMYVRAEYPLAVKRMYKAVADAEAAGILGSNVFNSGMKMKCVVMEGAGAFVCGEETALIASIEGLRGMPVPKPPFPAQSGLWGKPTVINNVETLAQVPCILLDGAEEYRKIGTPTSPGTKTFALTGHVVNTGLIEVPFGTTLGEIVLNIGGGVTDDQGKMTKDMFKAVQIGGPSGGCLTPDMLDLPLDFDSLRAVGAMVGSGGLVVMNRKTCMVSIARFFMEFTQRESCGKCVLCREGTKQLLSLLDDVIEGRATPATLSLMEQLGRAVQKGSLCGLGKTAPNPVLSTLRYFRHEYESHVNDKHCLTGRCKTLAKPLINAAKCKGCAMCVTVCPVGAITGSKKQPHKLNQEACIKCGACTAKCKFNAIEGI
ncbi:MAG TPA: NADH-ubiquinone oxidoreductase-F iron-sulfur binding region domain-containing protein [Dissulfurispiraceae bacterium]|nr:NADH-ubiquinone oxidoreductase-F iron-sulfur binding region domain-containing protein [Dissulfurispiraceae bacterium]